MAAPVKQARPAATLAPTHYVVMAVFATMGLPVSLLSISDARLLLLVTTVIVVGVSAASYQYFETPSRRLMLNVPWMRHLPQADPPKPLSRL
jgi:peptidoglycan/LPS O-acetylase OafA/YrhL